MTGPWAVSYEIGVTQAEGPPIKNGIPAHRLAAGIACRSTNEIRQLMTDHETEKKNLGPADFAVTD
ncbi:hypothetical protein [Streptomyces sp. NPDC051636]|uniref:hypothetical protein n=1 Tax=Streptomyces sp. NPDC051636 TaxID=3365663 RepID=UPI003790B411